MEKTYKVRASASYEIAAGSSGLTSNQVAEIEKLTNKDKLTPIQEGKLKSLVDKRDNPPIPEGLKTHCKNWFKNVILGKRAARFSNKYVEKGTLMEDEGIELASNVLGYPMLIKNEEFFSNEYFQGTPDIITGDEVLDIKCSWSLDTFPLFEDELPSKAYYWQLQVYMALTGLKKAKVIYCLVDTPDHLIEKEARSEAWNQGLDDVTIEMVEAMTEQMTYSDIEESKRIKVFEVERNDKDIELLIERVKTCRNYIKKLSNYGN